MNCAACGLNFERKDKGCQELQCQHCKLKYHRYCYGYNNTECICDPCSDNAKKPICCICGQKGLLKRLSDQSGVYVHVSCAIFAPHIEVINYHSMTFATKSQIDKKTKEKCTNCLKSGACIQCLDCSAYAHPHCIYAEQVEKAQEDIETEQWIFHLKFQANNQDPNQLDVSQSDVKSEIKDIQETFAQTVDKYKKRAQNLKDSIKCTLDNIFDNFSLPQYNYQWSQLNKVESYCQIHMENHRLFCICRKSLNNKQMVQCDHCYEWYHFNCIKRKNVKDDTYVCEACKVWSTRRNKIDLENPKLLNFEDLVIPKEVYILHLIDLLPLLLYIETIVKKLPTIPLTQNDYRNLKFYKLFLASLPIKPSTVIELDKVLLKERLQEELKQKMQSIIPAALETSEAFAEELVKQFKTKGYYFELGENKLIKSYIVTRKELKTQIKQGIAEGYLQEETLKLLEDGQADHSKVFKSPNDNLLQCIQRYKVAQTIRTQLRQMFECERMQSEHPQIENQLELTVYKQHTLLKNQKAKPHKRQLLDLKKIANMNNVTLKCLKLIDELIDELTELEGENATTSYRKIIELPINSDVLFESLQKYFEQEFIDEFKVELELKIENNEKLTEKEYTGLYNFENIQKAAKESIVIKNEYLKIQDIHQKCQCQKKVNITFCNEMIESIGKCLLTTQFIETQKIKLNKFKDLFKQLTESITLEQLEDIEHQCFQYGFDMNVDARRQQLEEAQQFLENNKPNLEDSLEPLKLLKSWDLNQYIKSIENQLDFVKQLYYVVHNKYDSLSVMLQRVKDIKELDFRNELLYEVNIPEEVHEELQPVVENFKQMKWKCECQRLLDQPNGNINGTISKKYNMEEIKQLLNADPQIQDPYYQQQLIKIQQGYISWMESLKEFESQLDPSSFNLLIRLINKNVYQDTEIQNKLWQYYIQMLWMQKAQEFIEQKATPQACKALINCAHHVGLDQNNRLLQSLKDNLTVMDDLARKLKEYQEQRFLWTKGKEQINNLVSYKSFYKYLESKPDAEQINEIYCLAKEYPMFKVKDLKEDLQEVKQVLAQYNDIVQKQLDNTLYITQLLKIRNYYCCCFLKVKNFCVQLMYNLIKQQSLKCLKQLNPTEQILQRLEEINLLVALGGEEWYQKLSLTYKGRQESINSEDFKFIDCSLNDDFEWIKWMEESSQNLNENFGIENKKQQKEHKIKKKSEKKNIEGITEELRQFQRTEMYTCFKKFSNWKNVNEQIVRNFEAQVFMEHNFNKEKYLKEIEKIKSIIKLNKQLELSYEEFKKAYKQLASIKKQVSSQSNNKQALQLECVKVIKKPQPQQQQSQLASAIKLVQQQREPELEKKIKPETPKQPTIIPQSVVMTNEVLMYNPDGQIDTTQTKFKNQLMCLGEVNLLIKKKQNDVREPCIIKPMLLTYDYQQAHFFPKTELITVTCDTYSPVKEVVEYLTQKKDNQFKMMIGWLYSKDLSVAGDLFKLADKLKHAKQCVGTKQGDFGFSLIYYEYLNKIKPTTKWILFKDEFENQATMNSCQKWHNLEKFKPHLCFVYYLKESKECHSTILPQPIQYVNVLKAPQFKKVIESHKQQLKKQQAQQKKRELEPISDEDNNHQEQKEEIHTMLMEIPGILNLLN